MCHFLNFIVSKLGSPFRIYQYIPDAIKDIEAAYNLTPGSYRVCEWAADDTGDSLTVRVCEGEDEAAYKAAILSKYPSRDRLIKAQVCNGKHFLPNNDMVRYKNGQLHGTCKWNGRIERWKNGVRVS
jgi:hypothetical protein